MKLLMILIILIIQLIYMVGEASQKLTSKQIEIHIVNTALKYGVEPELALAIANVESRMNPSAVGSLGEIGIYQLRPEYHDVKHGNTYHNIDVAIKYLAFLKSKCSRFGEAYFICYNNGPYRSPKHPTQFPYYKRVIAEMRMK